MRYIQSLLRKTISNLHTGGQGHMLSPIQNQVCCYCRFLRLENPLSQIYLWGQGKHYYPKRTMVRWSNSYADLSQRSSAEIRKGFQTDLDAELSAIIHDTEAPLKTFRRLESSQSKFAKKDALACCCDLRSSTNNKLAMEASMASVCWMMSVPRLWSFKLRGFMVFKELARKVNTSLRPVRPYWKRCLGKLAHRDEEEKVLMSHIHVGEKLAENESIHGTPRDVSDDLNDENYCLSGKEEEIICRRCLWIIGLGTSP